MNAPVIWLTVIPDSGKTTISLELEKYYQQKDLAIEISYGDKISKTLSNDIPGAPLEYNTKIINH